MVFIYNHCIIIHSIIWCLNVLYIYSGGVVFIIDPAVVNTLASWEQLSIQMQESSKVHTHIYWVYTYTLLEMSLVNFCVSDHFTCTGDPSFE